jgi:uncharacterized repeat protein (TIGR03803 family)
MRNTSLLKMACIAFAFCAVAVIASPAQTFNTLINFNGINGFNPQAGLVQGANGNFYGTASRASGKEIGTVFEITPAGKLTTLHRFCTQTGCPDGSYPVDRLLLASNGRFYGTTTNGGAYGYGTVFEITATGKLNTLYNFCAQSGCTDGANPLAPLMQASNGNFYGTTYAGGAHSWGTVFEITAAGKLHTIYSFCAKTNCGDGQYPHAGLTQASDGNFYGTTTEYTVNAGTIFRLTPNGQLTTIYTFEYGQGNPLGGLLQASDGSLYGTTQQGGTYQNGMVFKITTAGAFTELYGFNTPYGGAPVAGVVQGSDGNFYGTTSQLGAYNSGTVFQITPAGVLTTLHDFNDTDGAMPEGGLVQGTDGKFYGTTYQGGTNADGTVFSVSVGLQ